MFTAGNKYAQNIVMGIYRSITKTGTVEVTNGTDHYTINEFDDHVRREGLIMAIDTNGNDAQINLSVGEWTVV